MTTINVPSMGDSITEGTVNSWAKGEAVRCGAGRARMRLQAAATAHARAGRVTLAANHNNT